MSVTMCGIITLPYNINMLFDCNISKSTHCNVAVMFHCDISKGGHFNIATILQQRYRNISQPPCNVTMFQCNNSAIFLQHFGAVWVYS